MSSRRSKISMDFLFKKSMHCCFLTTKTISRLKTIQRKWTQNGFSNLKILAGFGPPYHVVT
jgi:hypothetical protein